MFTGVKAKLTKRYENQRNSFSKLSEDVFDLEDSTLNTATNFEMIISDLGG